MSDPTNAERQARWRAKRAKEIEELRKAVAEAAPASSRELAEARAEIVRLRNEAAHLRDEVAKLKAKIVKPVEPSLDPESEAARQIDALKKKNKALRQEADKRLRELRMQVPTAVRGKIAKALNEQTTSPAKRLDALQAWNGLGLNNIGR